MASDKKTLDELLQLKSLSVDHPAGKEIRVLKERDALRIAETCTCSVRQVYEAALLLGICPYRYIRNLEAVSLAEQLDLLRSRVAVVGAGGLGGQVILLLARMGIGHLVIVDHDIFDETNLNRQALCSQDTLGKPKAHEAAKVVGRINPGVGMTAHQVRLDESNAVDLLAGSDVVVDALDNVKTRFILEKTTRDLGIALVHGAVAGFEGRVMTILPDDHGMDLLYGRDGFMDNNQVRPEALLGVPAPAPALIATFQAMAVLKVLLKPETVSRNTMMHIDLEGGELNRFTFENHPSTE